MTRVSPMAPAVRPPTSEAWPSWAEVVLTEAANDASRPLLSVTYTLPVK